MTIKELCVVARMLNYQFNRIGKEHRRSRIRNMYWDKVERLAKKENKHVAIKH